MTTRKTADEVATLFATRADGTLWANCSWWLTQKQTAWLCSVARQDGLYADYAAHGVLPNGAPWTCRVSPVNGCGCFAIGTDAAALDAARQDQLARRRAELDATIAEYRSLLPGGAHYDALTEEEKGAVACFLPLYQRSLAEALEERERVETL